MELEVHNIVSNSPVQDAQRYTTKTSRTRSEQEQPNEVSKNNTQSTLTYTKEELETYLKKVFKNYPLLNRRLKFYINRELNQVVVKVIDSNTDKVIREIPPQELQNIRSRIQEALGLLFDIEI
jgi:flagellar protein FlaG